MRFLIILVLVFIVLAVSVPTVLYFFPQICFRPMPKALLAGNLEESKPNWVSSKVDSSNSHYVAPLPVHELINLANCMQKNINKLIISEVRDDYLVAYRRSQICNFVDWITVDNHGQVTSSATLGYSDFGKNRELVEQIRLYCAQSAVG